MKFYAVKQGRFDPQIYTDWESCKASVDQFPGAKFKSFSTEHEAKQYLLGIEMPRQEEERVGAKRKLDLGKPVFTSLKQPLVVFTDGACPNNGYNAQKGGVGVYFGDDDPRNVSECVYGNHVTNNYVELLAIQRALEYFIRQDCDKEMIIYTDSIYCINCLTLWRKGWKQRKWMKTDGKEILNSELIQKLDKMLETEYEWDEDEESCEARFPQEKRNMNKRVCDVVFFRFVKGHSGIKGNEKADQLAVKACS